jgi:hypothetical protein
MVEVISWDGRNRRIISRNIPKAISLLVVNNDLYIMDRAFSSVKKTFCFFYLNNF